MGLPSNPWMDGQSHNGRFNTSVLHVYMSLHFVPETRLHITVRIIHASLNYTAIEYEEGNVHYVIARL
jgi:hypothetical protein